MDNKLFERSAEEILKAGAIIITAGAGMGVDSGLPDFRGDRGFWNAYPMYERLGLNFIDCANPVHFERDPFFGWGFYGHRLNLYRRTVPHRGFGIVLNWIKSMNKKYFVVTSNVDGQFQKAGYEEDKIYEIHGSIHYLQCVEPCSQDIWENNLELEVDLETMRSKTIPKCRNCHRVARPNILMFGDYGWLGERSSLQHRRFDEFMGRIKDERIVIIEVGAGTAIPSIRHMSESLCHRYDGFLIRINLRESFIPSSISEKGIGFSDGAASVIEKIDRFINVK
ncbi:MAG: NAD-dependent deacetylase [Calditerrivibrio sp.]|nr:NAD-dependent deacetylase [Calditerrivibrio sp.]MCA1933294.1 NAD-dependent deacetylase [Calditerrivibrio sp.]MCA1980616.1 NAD-dependent deacetylase [Calditerrivibrio sp.]